MRSRWVTFMSWVGLLTSIAACTDAGHAGAGKSQPPSGAPADASTKKQDASQGPPALCSGCAGEHRVVGDNAAHFHHAHLNSSDVAASAAYYERVFGTVNVRLNGKIDVEKADGAFILFRKVDRQPTDVLAHGIEHIGWGSTDAVAWYATAQTHDVREDKRQGLATATYPFELYSGFFVVYLQGPSNERIEIFTEAYDEFAHVHFMTDDVDTTVAWYESLLDVKATADKASETMLPGMFGDYVLDWTSNTIVIDKVKMIFFGPPCACVPAGYQSTEDAPIHHIAFAFADLAPVIERVSTLGLEVVSAAAVDEQYGFRSLMVRAPNRVLVELVEAAAVPNPLPAKQ
jgi:catechol 2,3-dioxygenase-like lactoylglutathione lyase family enzyme